jgi:hypothetical protein
LCDDFDTDTVGSAPANWTLVGTAGCSGSGNPSAPTVYPIVVDTSEAHSPPNSVKISGGDSCGPLMMNMSAFSSLTTDVYGRFWVQLTSTTMTFDHTALMALGLTPSINIGDQSTYLQLASEGAGNATNVFMWQTTDGDILPDKNTTGGAQSTYPMGGAWTCIQFHTSTSGALETWVGGNATPVAGLTFVPGTTATTASVNDQWKAPSPFAPTSLGFGWIVFSGPMMSLWIDDVALGSKMVPCQ